MIHAYNLKSVSPERESLIGEAMKLTARIEGHGPSPVKKDRGSSCETRKMIEQYITQFPDVMAGEVAKGIGMSPQLVSHHMYAMAMAGDLERRRDGRRFRYTRSSQAREVA